MRVERRVLIMAQNHPVPFDRRVWLERQALVAAAYRMPVIRPKESETPELAWCYRERAHPDVYRRLTGAATILESAGEA